MALFALLKVEKHMGGSKRLGTKMHCLKYLQEAETQPKNLGLFWSRNPSLMKFQFIDMFYLKLKRLKIFCIASLN